ncbi:MAG: hypothetical protein KAR05_12345 [Candidatus Omnitrophica bacterium]|nr:hypothetical protein [Candidatus Omnitrophota bacterium]
MVDYEQTKKNCEIIQEYFNDKRYVEVLILGVQVIEMIANYIFEMFEIDQEKHMTEDWEKFMIELGNSLKKADPSNSPKIKALYLIEASYSNAFDGYEDCLMGIPLIQKLNRVIKARNDVAHYYYTKVAPEELRLRSKYCLELIDHFTKHPFFY